MIAYQKEKIENAVCFFASKHKEYTGKNLYQTSLFKYLALFEIEYLKETWTPATRPKIPRDGKGTRSH